MLCMRSLGSTISYGNLMYSIELWMEFYIRILDLFCERGDSVFELFVGTKLMVASVVSVASALSLA